MLEDWVLNVRTSYTHRTTEAGSTEIITCGDTQMATRVSSSWNGHAAIAGQSCRR